MKTRATLDLITDAAMSQMIATGMRGCDSFIRQLYAKANNDLVGEYYSDQPTTYISEWDANNRYRWGISQLHSYGVPTLQKDPQTIPVVTCTVCVLLNHPVLRIILGLLNSCWDLVVPKCQLSNPIVEAVALLIERAEGPLLRLNVRVKMYEIMSERQ